MIDHVQRIFANPTQGQSSNSIGARSEYDNDVINSSNSTVNFVAPIDDH